MNIKNIIKPILAIMLIAAVFFACDDMESIHEEYLQGETIYAGKLDSMEVFSGYYRVKIVGQTQYLGNASECIVEWEDNSQKFVVDNIKGDVFEMLIENLEERNYEFKVYTRDIQGNKSIDKVVVGKAFGDIFKASQFSRRIAGYIFSNGALNIKWADPAESEFVVKSVVDYENVNGAYNTDTIYQTDSLTPIVDWLKEGNVKIVSSIVTGYMGFDTLVLDPVYGKLPLETVFELDKSQISLAHMPSDNPGTGYGADPDQFLFDGNVEYNGDVEGYHSDEDAIPHHLTIDLGVMASIRKFRVNLRTDNWKGNNPTAIQLWGIADITDAETNPADDATFVSKGWIKLGEFTGLDENNSYHEFDLPEGSERVRYIRYRVTNSASGAAQATEMTFWGENIGAN